MALTLVNLVHPPSREAEMSEGLFGFQKRRRCCLGAVGWQGSAASCLEGRLSACCDSSPHPPHAKAAKTVGAL